MDRFSSKLFIFVLYHIFNVPHLWKVLSVAVVGFAGYGVYRAIIG